MHVRARETSGLSTATGFASARRSTQAERSARTRRPLLESAARELSRYGYGNLILERVASEAGYTRGALYHEFKDKEELVLAVLEWVHDNWTREVGDPARQEPDPVAELIALARGQRCLLQARRRPRRDGAADRVQRPGPSSGAHDRADLRRRRRACRSSDRRGAQLGTIPPGPPARAVAPAFFGALEGGDPARWTGAPR
jgi:AcrR family transcriptional regulator